MLKKLVLVLAFVMVAVVTFGGASRVIAAPAGDMLAFDPASGTFAGPWSSAILGAESWYAGALPPPGWHVIDYNLFYSASGMYGQAGDRIQAPPFNDFKATVYANVIRPIYVADFQILGATPAWHAVIPFIHVEQKSDSFSDVADGVGDIYVSPLILGWHKPPFHWVAGLDVITPTGQYSTHDSTFIGRNHWTFEPAFAVSYIGESGWTASTKIMYDIHTTDTSRHYREGQQLHLDYNAGYVFKNACNLKLGVSGYWLISLQDDKVHSNTIHNSGERVVAIGPSVGVQSGKLSAIVNVQKEFSARNRPQGVESWLNLIYSF